MGDMAARLVVSLSGLPAGTAAPGAALERAADLAAALDARGTPMSHLLRPRGDDGPARPGSPVVEWLLDRRARGDAVALHGFDHAADPIGNWGAAPRLGRRAEFATLPRHEAALRLTAARHTAAAAGLATDLFVPPRWLASPGTLLALREQGFTLCAEEAGVWLLPAGTLLRARLLGFRGERAVGEREPARVRAGRRKATEAWRCRLLVAETARTARRGGLVRIALRAKDLRRPARVVAALAAVDAALALGAVPATYRPHALTRAA